MLDCPERHSPAFVEDRDQDNEGEDCEDVAIGKHPDKQSADCPNQKEPYSTELSEEHDNHQGY